MLTYKCKFIKRDFVKIEQSIIVKALFCVGAILTLAVQSPAPIEK